MIKNKLVKKIAVALAFTGLFTVAATIKTTVKTTAAEAQSTFNVDSITGDYTVLNPTDYFLDCKNQGTVGKTINFTTNVSGYATYLGYTYTLSNKAEAKPGTVYGPYSCETFSWTPETAGLYAVNVKCQDVYGNAKYATQYVEINDKLSIDSFTSDHPYTGAELQGKAKLGETINLETEVSGGYKYTNKKYTYTISPRNASSDNRTVIYYNMSSSELAWTPKYSGIYAVNVKAKDDLGNTDNKTLYFMIEA